MSEDYGALAECDVKTVMTTDYAVFQVPNFVQSRAGIGQSFR